MVEIKWYARGGLGAFTASKLLGLAASLYDDSYAQAFPSFGPERRGAPVFAFTRVDKKPITDHSELATLDYAIVLDSTLLDNFDVTEGIKEGGAVIINTPLPPEAFSFSKKVKTYTFDGTAVSREVMKNDIVNTTMLAVLAAATGLVDMASCVAAVEEGMPAKLKAKNVEVVKAAYTRFKEGK